MSAMADMSRAIRHVLEDNATDGTLKGVPTPTLRDFMVIVGAFYADLCDEHGRREDKETS